MKTYWLSTPKMTVLAQVRDGIVISASPIIRRFVGQKFVRLIDWLARQKGGEFLVEELKF